MWGERGARIMRNLPRNENKPSNKGKKMPYFSFNGEKAKKREGKK